MLPKLVAVVGPTASGKTDIALAIARWVSDAANLANDRGSDPLSFVGAEIIVADSRQIYKGVNIASNKVADGRWQMADGKRTYFIDGIAYHGLDLVEPDHVLTVQQWKETTLTTITDILSRRNLPIIEGGTGLYVQSILDNYTFPDAPPDMAIRKRIEEQIEHDGLAAVVDELLLRDPDVARFLDIENPRRVVRALEVIEITSRPFSTQRGQGEKLFDDLRLGIEMSFNDIDDRIEERAKEQAHAGLEQEAKTMLERYSPTLPAMTSIGYAEWIPYFDGQISRDDVIEKNIRRNKRLARTQLKWFKRDPLVRWIRSNKEAKEAVERFLR